MRKRNIRNAALAAVCCGAVLLSGISARPVIPAVTARAVTQEELQQKIADNEKYIKELDEKIASLDGDIADSEQKQEAYAEKLARTKEQIDLINYDIYNKEQEISDKEKEIAAKEDDIALVELKIQDTEAKIADKEAQIQMLQKQNDDNVYRFGQIVRAMYITDSDDYLSIIAGSADFYDIFVRTEIMNSARQQNLDFMNQLLADIDKLEQDKLDLADVEKQLQADKEKLKYDKDVLGTERSNLVDDKLELDDRKTDATNLNATYSAEFNRLADQITGFEQKQANYAYLQKVSREEIEAYEKQIDEIIRRAQQQASNTVVYDNGDWLWPLDPRFALITTYFGYDDWRKGNHGGIDIGNGGIAGANIYASKAGEVIVAKTTYTPGYDYGMYVVIDHGNGYQTLYAHCSALYVTVGQMVSQGQTIASVGSTGWATGPHLHFEVRKDGARVDPLGVVKKP